MTEEPELFSRLAEDYAAYRPSYPVEVVQTLSRECGLTSDWTIADVGSGTGNLARLFLDAGCTVIGIEPNREMREAGERLLGRYPKFTSIEGAAERIPLNSSRLDIVTVGQAIHWFDIDGAKAEFLRILRPVAWVAVLWNDRLADATAFTREYDTLTRGLAVDHPPPYGVASLSTGLESLIGAEEWQEASFPNSQRFDLSGFLGRARSSGYIPQPGAPGHEKITGLMTDLFARHQQDGKVEFFYVTRLHFGRL